MLMRSARVVQVLQDLLQSCIVDVIGFCCNLQPCMLHVASCIVVVIGVLAMRVWVLLHHLNVLLKDPIYRNLYITHRPIVPV